MAEKRILQLGDPLLRAISTPVRTSSEAAGVLTDLRDTLHAFQRAHGFGRGISAVQIGDARRVIYIESEGAAYSIVNPVYESLSDEKFRLWDDCFSFPNLLVKLERSRTVELRCQDEHGAPRMIRATGSFAELLQHEIDHLDGVLAVDRALDSNSLATREEWERRYRGKIVE